MAEYNQQRDYLYAGSLPPNPNGITLDELVNRFLHAKAALVKSKQRTAITQDNYVAIAKDLFTILPRELAAGALQPEQFAELREGLSRKQDGEYRAPGRIRTRLVMIRSIFNWGLKRGLIDRLPMYGEQFELPPASELRLYRYEHGKSIWEPEELQKILAEMTRPQGRAMILLGINAAFQSDDYATLKTSEINLEEGIIAKPRGKTNAPRRAILWPETIEALEECLAWNEKKNIESDLVLLNRSGNPFRSSGGGHLSTLFRKAAIRAGVDPDGRSLHHLRHTAISVAEETLDFPATQLLSGHSDALLTRHGINPVSSHYRLQVLDTRLKDITEHL
ncbi:MAG: tyrosine-type recombinase/integrase [Phycisphaerales bacterium]|nr:tyrosine-type recombinase/integrase [Phycisphaerales bacterium]